MSEFLYELIHGLSTNEKVYFKRMAKTHGNKRVKNYVKIYEAIEGMSSYKTEDFRACFSGTSIEKYLSSEVDYLTEKLLISLFNYNLNRSKREQIQKGIFMVEILASKGFRKEALKKIKTIKKYAYKYEEFTWILRLIELEERILFKEGIIGYKEKLEELREQRSEITSKIQNLNTYHIIRQEIREFQFSKTLISNDLKPFRKIINNPLVLDNSKCLSLKAKEHWYYIQVLLNYLKRDFNLGLSISADYVNFMFLNKHLFAPNKTLPALSNYIYHASLTKNKKHFDLGQEILITFYKNKEVAQFYLDYILHTRNLEFAYYTYDLIMMQDYLKLASNLLDEESENLEESQIQYLYMLIVRSAIVLKKHKLGMKYSNQWHQRGILSVRKVQARLYSIIVHYEIGYLELIESEIIQLKKLGKENPREKELIEAFYQFFNSLVKYQSSRSIHIKKLQEKLAIISQKNTAYFDFISFDYYQWSLDLK